MIGVLSWCITAAISIIIFVITDKFLSQKLLGISSKKKSIIAIILSAIITDILIHIFITIQSSFSEMMMWFSISFPFVGLCLILVNFAARIIFEWKNRA